MEMSRLKVDRDNRVFSKRIIKSSPKSQIEDVYSPLWQSFIPKLRNAHMSTGLAFKDAHGLAMADIMSVRAIALKKYHSFYIADKSVVDFVKNTKLNDKEISQMHAVVHGVAKEYRNYGFVVHMSGENQSILYTFGPDHVYKSESLSESSKTKGLSVFHKRYCEHDLADIGFTVLTPDEGIVGGKIVNAESGSEEWKIFFNLCLYMSAFPEYVVDGAPPIKIHGSRHNSTTIKASRQIKDVYRDGVSPHMRRGHFRFLRNERYKEKRFQTIYVKPTMVRGRASTVIGDE